VAWAWLFLDGSGQEAGRSGSFPDRESAEEWMGTAWQDLLSRGYREAALVDLDRNRRLYEMGLGPG
jgi:hypothetical protein